MADNGSANRANNRAYRQAQQAGRPRVNTADGSTNKGNKFANAGAAAGGFIGAMGGSFVPPVNITVNNNKNKGAGIGGRSRGGSAFVLGDPEFNNTEDVRNYCNHARALMIQVGIELAMASKILEARLAQAQRLPGDNPIESRMRAKKVGWKLKRAADGATAAAKGAVGAYGAFTREYADIMRPRPQQAPPVNPFRF
ncbi:plasmid transfer protein TraA [Streptomyces tauricus]|uniref:plasmid transfer protein TraA n=1 Tax=Streptomyces tauricus TaxID=68274 RepID=UPI00342CC719